MSLQIATVISSIAGLAVSGLKVCSLSSIPEAVDIRTPTIFPRPDGMITNFTQERLSQNSQPRLNVVYTLHYRFCHTPIGSGRGLFTQFPAMVNMISAFIDAVQANDTLTGAVDVAVAEIDAFGPVTDPSGIAFHGCDISITIMEFVN